jgi:hypothetical protein
LVVKVAAGLSLLALATWACLSWRQGPFTALVNTGQVCLRAGEGREVLEASFSPGCYSATCTRALHQSGSAEVDAARGVLRFSTRFLLRRLDFPRGTRSCDRNCGDLGRLTFHLTGVQPRVYTVMIGSRTVGEVVVPLVSEPACFDNQPPYPTVSRTEPPATPVPTATPRAYPAPLLTPLPTLPPGPYPVVSLETRTPETLTSYP